MSHSRKKAHLSEISHLSATEKVRGTTKSNLFRRKCCDKENECSRQCRSKDECKSLKKNMKKKYLQEEVEKVLQKRYQNTGNVIKELREHNTNEIEGLREDLKSMKDVIYKLSIQDHGKGKDQALLIRQLKENRSHKVTEDVRMELSSQMEANMRIKNALKQTEKQAKQAKEQVEELKAENAQFHSELIQLSNVKKLLEESQVKNTELQALLQQAYRRAQEYQKQEEEIQNNRIQQQETSIKEISQLKSKIQAFEKEKATFEQQLQQKSMNELQVAKQEQKLRNELKSLKEKYKIQCSQKKKLEAEVNKTRLQLNKASIDLGNTKTKLGGLVSMEKKCEQLYEEIKKEKFKWNQFSLQKNNQKEIYEEQLATFKEKIQELERQLKNVDEGHKKDIQTFKVENYRLFEDKIRLSKEIKSISAQQGEQQQLTMMEMKINTLEETLKENEIERVTEKVKLSNRVQALESEIKRIVEDKNEAKINIETMRKNNEQLQKQNICLNQQKGQLQSFITQAKQTLSQTQRKYEKLNTIFSQTQRQKSFLNDTIKELTNQITNLKEFLTESSQSVDEFQQELLSKMEEIQSLKRIIEELKEQNDSKSGQIDHQTNVIHAYSKEKQVLMRANCEAEETNDRKERKIQQLLLKLGQSEEKIISQQNQMHIINTKIEKTEALLQQAIQNSTKNQSKVRITIIQLEQQYETIKVKLEVSQKESQQWREKNHENERKIETERHKYEVCEERLRDSQSLQLSLSEQLNTLHETSQRNQEQLNWYQQEISFKNKSIAQLKQTLKAVKSESLLIREQVDTYRSDYQELQELKDQQTARSGEVTKKYEELEQFTMDQIHYMRERLDQLAQTKVKLELQMSILHQHNQQLEKKIVELDKQDLLERERQICLVKIRSVQQKLFEKDCEIEKIKDEHQNECLAFKNELNMRAKEIQMISSILEEQRSNFSRQIMEVQSSSECLKIQVEQQEKMRLETSKLIEQKQETINKLMETTSSFQQKKAKVISEVQGIQAHLMELSEKNDSLQSENESLQQQNMEKQEKLKIYQQKINILIESKYALEEQKIALQQQSKMLQQQISKVKNRQKSIEEQYQKQIQDTYESCERRKNEIVESLKSKVIEVSNELDSIKSGQLTQIKGEREKLISINNQKNAQIQSLQLQIQSKQREYECLTRDRTITREKFNEVQSKYLTLLKKYEQSQQDRCLSQRDLESQSAALRVLREENKNIEKVMSDQLNQRTVIIQQLVNEKRMLYTQFQRQ